ncbi:MAG: hypothetical protein M5U28_21930 [Sandaracinaceae bacterium]|nr:hypothetical protein [Sandaracinaceae bacterium]
MAIVLAACHGVPEADAGSDAGPGTDAAPPADPIAPDIPWLGDGVPPIAPPSLTPCPEGWREVREEGEPARCDPYPEGGARDCPDGEAHFPGEPGCAPISGPCAADGWPAASTEPTLHVRAGAPAGGDGTRAAPLATIAEALARASDGHVIAIAIGTYDEVLDVASNVTLRGACADGTRIEASATSATDATIDVTAPGARIEALTVAGSARGAISVGGAGTVALTLRGVAVRGARPFGIRARGAGASATLARVVVEGTTAEGSGNGGVMLLEGASGRIERAVVEANERFGVLVDAGGQLDASDLVVRDTRPEPSSGGLGRAISAGPGARVALARLLVEGARSVGVAAIGADLDLRDTVVRDVLPQASDGALGNGLVVQDTTAARIARATIERTHFAAIGASGASLVVEDCLVRETEGRGVHVGLGSNAQLARVRIERSVANGLLANAGSAVSAADVGIVDTRYAPFPATGAVLVHSSSHVVLVRGLVERSESVALFAVDARLEVTDVAVRAIGSRPTDQVAGYGLSVVEGASALLTRVVVDGAREAAIRVHGAASALELNDSIVRNVAGRERDGSLGAGLAVESGASAALARVRIEDTRFAGVYARAGGSVDAIDVSARGVRPAACAATTCAETGGGHGLAAYLDGASITARRFSVADAEVCGVLVGDGSDVDLFDGEVARAPIGVCMQAVDYDLSRLTEGVRYLDVGVPLQATSYELPDELARIEL